MATLPFGSILGQATAANYLSPAEQAELNRQKTIAAETAKSSGKKKVSLMDILTGAGTIVGSLLGAKAQAQNNMQVQQAQQIQPYYPPFEEKKDKTIWIVLAVLLVVVVVAIVIIKSKKKG